MMSPSSKSQKKINLIYYITGALGIVLFSSVGTKDIQSNITLARKAEYERSIYVFGRECQKYLKFENISGEIGVSTSQACLEFFRVFPNWQEALSGPGHIDQGHPFDNRFDLHHSVADEIKNFYQSQFPSDRSPVLSPYVYFKGSELRLLEEDYNNLSGRSIAFREEPDTSPSGELRSALVSANFISKWPIVLLFAISIKISLTAFEAFGSSESGRAASSMHSRSSEWTQFSIASLIGIAVLLRIGTFVNLADLGYFILWYNYHMAAQFYGCIIGAIFYLLSNLLWKDGVRKIAILSVMTIFVSTIYLTFGMHFSDLRHEQWDASRSIIISQSYKEYSTLSELSDLAIPWRNSNELDIGKTASGLLSTVILALVLASACFCAFFASLTSGLVTLIRTHEE